MTSELSDLTPGDKRKLVDLARAIVERARSAGPPLPPEIEDSAAGLPTLALQQGLDPKALIDFADGCRRQLEGMRRHMTAQLDAMLLVLERFEVELTALQGALDGVRAEQRLLLNRLTEAEQAVRGSADELVDQVSQRFLGLLDNVDRATGELIEGRKQFAEATAALLDRLRS